MIAKSIFQAARTLNSFKTSQVSIRYMVAGVGAFFCLNANAGLISGFEPGFTGWEKVGDASIQTSAIGMNPTQGSHMAFLTTMSRFENPYSGEGSPSAAVARSFIGLAYEPNDFLNAFPPESVGLLPGQTITDYFTSGYGVVGESAAIKTTFYVSQPGFLSFDWNRLGMDGDTAYFSLSNATGNRPKQGWIYEGYTYTDGFSPSGVDLCSRVDPASPYCSFYNSGTGWHTTSLEISEAGSYTIGFALGEILEGTTPTVLALDNVRFSVPEPSTLPLLGCGLIAALLFRRIRLRVCPRA